MFTNNMYHYKDYTASDVNALHHYPQESIDYGHQYGDIGYTEDQSIDFLFALELELIFILCCLCVIIKSLACLCGFCEDVVSDMNDPEIDEQVKSFK